MKTQKAKDKRQRALRQSTAGARRRTRSLLADTELADQLRVPVGILPFEIVEQTPALAHQLQEAAPRVMVLKVRLEVLGEVINALAEQRDLDFRGTRISGMGPIATDQLTLTFIGQH